MTEVGSINFIAVVVCDDVRKEISNKEILIGVYGAELVVQSYPALINPSFWIQMLPLVPGEFNLEMRLIDQDEQHVFSINGVVRAPTDGDLASSQIGGQPFPVSSDLDLRFQAKVEDSDWLTLRELRVRRATSS